MEAEMYFHTKAFLLPKWNDNEKRTECAFNREDFERVVRLTEKVSKGDEPTFHAIMETFIKVYPEVKKYKELSEKTYDYPEYKTIIEGLSELYQKGQKTRTALNRAEHIELTIRKGILVAISIKTPNKTYRLATKQAEPDDSIYIHNAHFDLQDNEELKHLLSGESISLNNDDADFHVVKEFLQKTLERSKEERTMRKDFSKKLYDTLKVFDQVIRNTKKSENQQYRRNRKTKISIEESAKYIKAVLELDFNAKKLRH